MKGCGWMTYHLGTYYNCAYEQENQQTNDDVLDSVLTMSVIELWT